MASQFSDPHWKPAEDGEQRFYCNRARYTNSVACLAVKVPAIAYLRTEMTEWDRQLFRSFEYWFSDSAPAMHVLV
jgi:hypothetical protein